MLRARKTEATLILAQLAGKCGGSIPHRPFNISLRLFPFCRERHQTFSSYLVDMTYSALVKNYFTKGLILLWTSKGLSTLLFESACWSIEYIYKCMTSMVLAKRMDFKKPFFM